MEVEGGTEVLLESYRKSDYIQVWRIKDAS